MAPAGGAPRGTIERALAGLHPGDVLELDTAKVSGRVAVLSVAQRKGGTTQLRVITRRAKVLRILATDLQAEPLPVARIELPQPYTPNDEGFRQTVVGRLGDSTGPDPVPVSESDEPADHAVAACPDVDDHLRAARRARRLAREITRTENRRTSHHRTLADQFDRVLDLLERWGHLQGWALTARGELLASTYHESDLLVSEALAQGLFDDLDPAALAALASCLTYEHRSPEDPPPPWFPSTELRGRFDDLVRVADRLRHDEVDARLPTTRVPDAGFVPLAFGWAGGEDLADVLEEEELSGGDFVRNVRQLLDLLRQLAELAPDPGPRPSPGRPATGCRGAWSQPARPSASESWRSSGAAPGVATVACPLTASWSPTTRPPAPSSRPHDEQGSRFRPWASWGATCAGRSVVEATRIDCGPTRPPESPSTSLRSCSMVGSTGSSPIWWPIGRGGAGASSPR